MKNTVLKPVSARKPEEDINPFDLVVDGRLYRIKPVLRNSETLSRIPVECLPINMPLPCPLYAKIGGNFIMFRIQKDEISEKRIKSLLSSGTKAIYIPKIFWNNLMTALENLELSPDSPDEDKVRHIRALLMSYSTEIDHPSKSPKESFFDKIEKLSSQIAESIYRDPTGSIRLLRRNVDPSIYFINHAVNSGIYAALMGKSLNYPLEDIRILMYGGVVHDIGNLFIPKNILFKRDRLSNHEIAIIQTHCEKGAQLLKSFGLDSRVVLMALQHHERVDRMGYPKGISGENIHPFAKIIAIADVFDAITCDRPHQKGLSSQEAMRRMRRQEGLFDVQFLNAISCREAA